MKKFNYLPFLFLLILFKDSQASNTSAGWQTDFGNSKVFVENRGQFNISEEISSNPVLYAFDNGASKVYFSKSGLVYSLKKIREIKNNETDRHGGQMEGESESQVEYDAVYVSMNFESANPAMQVNGLDPTGEQFSYTFYENGKQKIENNLRAYKKIMFENLYPGIDAIYEFHPAEGIKYSFIVHPGADPSLIKMKYSGSNLLSLQNGELKINTPFGHITDHQPKTFYKQTAAPIYSSFVLNNNLVQFATGTYDNTQIIVIDPWTVTPAMPNSQKVWEIEADSMGNAYIYGGDWPNCKLQKYNLAGTLQWTNITAGYDSSSWIGTLVTDRSGYCYVTIGSAASIKKVTPSGSTLYNTSGGLLDEYWALTFNCDYTRLYCGGTRLTGLIPTGDGKAFEINMNNGNVISNVTVAKSIPSFIISDVNEIRSICSAPNGNIYFHTLDTIGELTQNMGINWRLLTSYSYAYSSPNYGFTPQPQHVICASNNYIYTMNGTTLFRRDIATGAVINQVTIPGGGLYNPPLVQGISPKNNGLCIDSCGNVYVGSTTQVHKYDAALNHITAVTVPAAVYDVEVGTGGAILVCGNGYAASVNLNACGQVRNICTTTGTAPESSFTASDNTICAGSCISFTDQSSNAPTSWTWTFPGGNPGSSSSQHPSNICFNTPGSYTVSLLVSNASGSHSSAQTITVYALPVVSAGTDTGLCIGSSVQLLASGASGYAWQPSTGLNNATIAGPTASPAATTTYAVTGTDVNGCTATDAVSVTVHPLPPVAISPAAYNLCKGQGIQLTAFGAATYTWEPSVGLSGTSGSAVFANPNSTTTYSATGTDNLGCKAEATSVITVSDQPFVIASITNATACPGGGAIALTLIGGVQPYQFNWSNGATTQNLTNVTAGNYTVTVTSGPCTVITTYTVGTGIYNPTVTVTQLYSCSARLNWTATPSTAYYKVRYKIAGTTSWSPAVNVGTALYYDFTGLASNTNYYFQVAAFCSNNQNLGWKQKSGKTQVCTMPIAPSVTQLTNTTATISWSSACSPQSFKLRYRKTGFTAWSSVTTSALSVTLTGLNAGNTYEYQVRSVCASGINSAYTTADTFLTAPRMEDNPLSEQFSIIPNPNNGTFGVQLPRLNSDATLAVYNTTGQLVFTLPVNVFSSQNILSVSLQNAPPGIYHIKISSPEIIWIGKMLIQ